MPFPSFPGLTDISHDTADFRIVERASKTVVQIFPRKTDAETLQKMVDSCKEILREKFRFVPGKAELVDEPEVPISACIEFPKTALSDEDLRYLREEFPKVVAKALR